MKKMKYLALLSPLFFIATSLHAETYEATAKPDLSSDLQTNNAEEEQAKSVIVTGYGVDHDAALKNALQTAVEQQIGVLIDSETIIKNDAIIKNEILTASNGFVKKYDELSTSTNNGLTEVKVKAEVKSQAVANKIKSLNFSTLKVADASNSYAEATTKEKSKEDRKAMLIKTLTGIDSPENYTKLLSVKLDKYDILTDKNEGGKTPIDITYEVEFNYPAYEEIIKNIETTLEGIGAKVTRKTDYPKIIDNLLEAEGGAEKPNENSISIIKKNGSMYVKDTWDIPVDIIDLKTINLKGHEDNKITIELTDNKGNILDANKKNISRNRFYYNYNRNDEMHNNDYFYGHDGYHDINVFRFITFAPFFQSKNPKYSEAKIIETIKDTLMVNTESLKNLDKINIQYQ